MKNLDQIRATNAIAHRQRIADSKGGGDAVSGFPMLLLTDGLLAGLAFACEEKEVKPHDVPADNHPERYLYRQVGTGEQRKHLKRKNPGEYTVARAVAEHLAATGNPVTTWQTADALLAGLAAENSDVHLRRATAEAIQFLNYLKRFVA